MNEISRNVLHKTLNEEYEDLSGWVEEDGRVDPVSPPKLKKTREKKTVLRKKEAVKDGQEAEKKVEGQPKDQKKHQVEEWDEDDVDKSDKDDYSAKPHRYP